MSDDGIAILQGPPIPTLLPPKGVGVFKENGSLKFFVLSQFNNSDTTVRTPISFKDAAKVFWAMMRGK